jgi:hypothetical protein
MKTCPQCGGETVSLIHNLRTGARLCWRCIEVEPSKLESEYPMQDMSKSKWREGVWCLRCVQVETIHDGFQVVFLHAKTNVEAMERAFRITGTGTGGCSASGEPITAIQQPSKGRNNLPKPIRIHDVCNQAVRGPEQLGKCYTVEYYQRALQNVR